MRIFLSRCLAVSLIYCLIVPPAANAAPSHALTLYGEPNYSPGFTHFAYTNPDAPKGGTVRLSYSTRFDSLNPFILKGLSAPGVEMLFESLMVRSLDEPQSYYGLIATSVELAEDRRSIIFTLNPNARWHDGTAITPEDVIFSLETLKTKGDPAWQMHYRDLLSAEKTARHQVKIHFENPENRELPFIAASLPVISKAYYSSHDFEKSSLEVPLASGPYTIDMIDVGRSITYRRVENYWGDNLPTRRGQYNFERIRYDVYRDATVTLEALKAKEFDFYQEYIARNWATAYHIPAVERGELIKYTATHKIPRGMQAFIFNLRKTKFSDPRVREAISLTMDFEWLNRTIFFDAYKRNISFFQNTDFEARGTPSPEELALLEPWREQLTAETFGEVYRPPVTDGSGAPRRELLKAQALLNEAGWELKDGKRVHRETGELLSIEFLSRNKAFERVVAAMIRNLNRLGIQASFRFVDDAQYQKRLDSKDFDMISIWWNRGLIFPGNEQRLYWHSSQADIPGGQNMTGLKSEAVDTLLDHLVNAKTLEELTTASHALDRTLLWKKLIIPHWHLNHFRVAFWDMFAMPETRPIYGLGFETWWLKDMEER